MSGGCARVRVRVRVTCILGDPCTAHVLHLDSDMCLALLLTTIYLSDCADSTASVGASARVSSLQLVKKNLEADSRLAVAGTAPGAVLKAGEWSRCFGCRVGLGGNRLVLVPCTLWCYVCPSPTGALRMMVQRRDHTAHAVIAIPLTVHEFLSPHAPTDPASPGAPLQVGCTSGASRPPPCGASAGQC